MDVKSKVIETFKNRFGESPQYLIRAPGRVNLIGEHTDYNDGFVLPMAINRAIWIAVRPRADKQVLVWSIDFNKAIEFDLDNFTKSDFQPGEYVKGVAWALTEAGYGLAGWEGVLGGDIPIGAGLSSSAALELASARAFFAGSLHKWNPREMAKLAQKAENRWVGMNCGIMDQMISAAGVSGHALLIDCRSLEITPAPLPEGVSIVILDTGTRRELTGGAYNQRRQECETAAILLGVPALRDITLPMLIENAQWLEPVIQRRAHHVITENQRTLHAVIAMCENNAVQLGQLINYSHDSLRDDFEVSSPALDSITEIARTQEACYGARMTGGGFGGCAVALVQSSLADQFVATVGPEYQRQTGHTSQLYICAADAGADIVRLA